MGWNGPILLGLGLAAGLAILGVLAARKRARVLDRLTSAIGDLAEGRTIGPVLGDGVGPFRKLARTLAEVGPRLEEKFARLERDRQQLGAVLGGMAEGVVAVDARRRVLFANEAAARLFGFGPVAVGRLVTELIRSPKLQEALDATLKGTGPYRGEILVTRPEGWKLGQPQVLDVQGTPLPGSPTPGAVLVFHDLTELRRLEGMRQDFVANASHELKTPLASIKVYTETLLDGALHDETVNVAFLRRIDEQADRLDRLIQDLLKLARLESSQDVFRHAPLDLVPVVSRIVESQRARADDKGLDYALEAIDEPESMVVVADEEAIRQILDNLVDNAIKYTPQGGRVRVSIGRSGGFVRISVADSGIGIPRDEQSRVFERFYRVDKARSRELGGTGLGLSIVKHLAQSLGGRVSLQSRPGSGSTFVVELPRTEPRRPEAEPVPAATGD